MGRPNMKRANEEDEEEMANVVDSLLDQLDEEWGRSKELAPVQYFDPKQEGWQSCKDSLSFSSGLGKAQ